MVPTYAILSICINNTYGTNVLFIYGTMQYANMLILPRYARGMLAG